MQIAKRPQVQAGSHLQREIYAADTDEELLIAVRAAACEQPLDPATLVAASQRLSHLGTLPEILGARSNVGDAGSGFGTSWRSSGGSGGSGGSGASGASGGAGARDAEDAETLLEDAILAQLEHFSSEQTACLLHQSDWLRSRPLHRRASLLDAVARLTSAEVATLKELKVALICSS